MNSVYSLKQVANFVEDRVPSNALSVDTYISTENLLPNKAGVKNALNLPPKSSKSPAYRRDDILISNIRPYLKKIWFSNRDGGCSADVLVLRAKDDINPKFLYYALFRDDFFAHAMRGAKGTKMPRGDKAQILEFTIPKFKAQQQEEIVAILSTIDAKIDCNNKINAELESVANMLFDYWFVQFQFPDANGKPYKSFGGTMIYNDVLKREIPLGWNIKELGQIADLYQPKTISEKEMTNDGKYLVYGANGIVGRYDQYNHEESMVAITCRGNSCGEINITRPYSWITGNAMIVKPKTNVSIDYLFNTLKRSGINKIITGSAQPQITRSNLSPLSILCPDESLIADYTLRVSAGFKKRIFVLRENELLENLRDWLLPMLMNGQVTIL